MAVGHDKFVRPLLPTASELDKIPHINLQSNWVMNNVPSPALSSKKGHNTGNDNPYDFNDGCL